MPLSETELPQELIEKIIDDLSDDTPSLLACCLVNQSFLPASQRHLRSSLRLHGKSMATTLGLFDDAVAPLVTTLRLSDLAGRKQPAPDDRDIYTSREDMAVLAAFSALTPRLTNVSRLVVDASPDAYVYGMRFAYIPSARVSVLQAFITSPSHFLYSLTFRNIQLHWSVLVIIAQCSSLKELRMEDVVVCQPPPGGEWSPYPAEALAALESPKPVLETLVLHNPDDTRRPLMCYWGRGMFSQFIRGLIVSAERSNWADTSKLQRFEYYEGIWSDQEHWDVKKLLDNAHDLKEFVWRHWRNANPFDLSHLPNVDVCHLERPKYY